MSEKIATDIPTSVFYQIVDWLKENEWQLVEEYDPDIFDKSIDFDSYLFKKNKEEMLMVWDVWFEGEIKANDIILKNISLQIDYDFEFGKVTHLIDKLTINKINLLSRKL